MYGPAISVSKKEEHMPVIKSLREDGWIESNAANEVRD